MSSFSVYASVSINVSHPYNNIKMDADLKSRILKWANLTYMVNFYLNGRVLTYEVNFYLNVLILTYKENFYLNRLI